MIKDKTVSLTSGDYFYQSTLPRRVDEMLQQGMRDGFIDGYLNLAWGDINDAMMPELSARVLLLGDKVKGLNLSNNKITSAGMNVMFDTFKRGSAVIKRLGLNGNQLDDDCMSSLGDYIKNNSSLETVFGGSLSLSDVGIEILAPFLSGNTTFKCLYLAGNRMITNKSVPLLLTMIESTCIEDLNIESTSITMIIIFIDPLARNAFRNGTRLLSFGRKKIDDNIIKNICKYMKEYGASKLKEINLNENEITSKGASLLFNALKECQSVISSLFISVNQLNDECLRSLGEFIVENKSLEVLYISNNLITDKGIEILSEYLIGNTALQHLDLNNNKNITDLSYPHFVDIATMSALSIINIWGTSISEDKKKELDDMLEIPTKKREIPIKSCTKSAAKISSTTCTFSSP